MKVAAFNIKNLGKKKVNNKKICRLLTKIISRYSVIMILEVVDKSGKAMEKLHRELNSTRSNRTRPYSMVASMQLGRDTYKERFVCFYSHTYVPFVKDLVVIPVHTKPEDSWKELNELNDVVDAVRKNWGSDVGIVVYGDPMLRAVVSGSAKSFNFQKKFRLTDKEVSDHYPVEVELRSDQKHKPPQQQKMVVSRPRKMMSTEQTQRKAPQKKKATSAGPKKKKATLAGQQKKKKKKKKATSAGPQKNKAMSSGPQKKTTAVKRKRGRSPVSVAKRRRLNESD
ncbi:hypothetical protein INR49_000166 [Caranx melampygus]|nr:hypothetical protein INR49_000166 [Caranx melampygus]